jgi:hypothetical protein
MLAKFTRFGVAETREIAEPGDPVAEFAERLEGCFRQFRNEPVTPPNVLALENALGQLANDLLRQVLEEELNRLEIDDKKKVPAKVRYDKQTYRINKKTKLAVATRFGTITLRSFYYLNEEDGEPGLHPLRVRLGIGAGSATLAFAERVARLSVDHTQAESAQRMLQDGDQKHQQGQDRLAR